MTGNDIRSKFLQFFAERGHTVVESSPLVPQDDPTLLFTNAGMVQFKKVFMGEEKRNYVRAATCQRCVRAGGKHNDLENVGHTARHHTFFEMLGNFSFGDYFKEEAIRFAWKFLTVVLNLPKEKLWISVFEKDDEAYSLWEKIDDVPADHIIRLGEKDNFWAMGDTGPCGPCSEILIDQGPAVGCGRPECKAGCDCDRYLELWNLVFMQFNRDADGSLTPLPKPSIDTGMGLERIAAVVQGQHSNYDSDLFAGLLGEIGRVTGTEYGAGRKTDAAMRVIADHSRATAFLVADGVLPSNEGRGYVLRRIMRRAIRFGRLLGLDRPFLATITGKVVKEMAVVYPHLREADQLLAQVVRHEEERFLETLDNGLARLQGEIERLKAEGEPAVSGEFIFKLYDTYGFPVDIVRDMALEEGLVVDEAGFNEAMATQRQLSRQSWKGGGLAEMPPGLRLLLANEHKSRFVGYDTRLHRAPITGLLNADGELVETIREGETGIIVCAESPFYAEAGGQVGDEGEIAGPAGRARIGATTSADGLILHHAEVIAGELTTGEEAELKVREGRRQLIANNHTATHLLHAALKGVLGSHVKQSGSLVEPDRLRFDFTHFSPLTPEEKQRVETLVNEEVRGNRAVTTKIMGRDEAIRNGATALFGEKYGDQVRVVSIGPGSVELCGGTHVGATGEIGSFKIVAEGGVAAGIRRIEAVTGPEAFARFQCQEARLQALADKLKTAPDELESRVDKLMARQKELEKEVSQLNARLSLTDLDRLLAGAKEVAGVEVLAAAVPIDSPKTLREIGDRVRDKMDSGIAVLGGVAQGKAALLVLVSKDLTDRYQAGKIVKEVAAIVGGSGGGRPDMAQAGGPLVDKLPEAITAVGGIVEEFSKKTTA
ncbi:MAG: alanine--tRNA ligase [Deltaproteobacteria bacterium]